MKKLLLFFIILFIVLRTFYYIHAFNFVHDQVTSSTTVLEMWKNKSFPLIGPPLSFSIEGRQIFFGGVSYYIQLIFLLLGRFNPFWSTYIFMTFSGIMCIPLYIGISRLINRKSAILALLLYSMTPLSITSTTFLWNPYFQYSLLPLCVYLLYLFRKRFSLFIFLLLSVLNGILFQLHYMYVFSVIGLFLYFFVVKKYSWKYLFIYLVGFFLGALNLIVFEVRHHFYTIQTLMLYKTHPNQLIRHWFSWYYILPELFFIIIIFLYLFRKQITTKVIIIFSIILTMISIPFIIIHAQQYHYPKDWSYNDELRVYSIIKNNLNKYKDFNIFEFYTADGNTLKYFLKKDNISIQYDDYYHNKYLYVVYKNDLYLNDVAYEVHSFRPSRMVQQWKINQFYRLFLLERL